MAHLTKRGLDQLTALVKTRLKRMQYRPGLIATTCVEVRAAGGSAALAGLEEGAPIPRASLFDMVGTVFSPGSVATV
jgi:hypothetical protein